MAKSKLTKQQVADVLLTIVSDALNESLGFTYKDDPMGYGEVIQDLIAIKRKIRVIRDKE